MWNAELIHKRRVRRPTFHCYSAFRTPHSGRPRALERARQRAPGEDAGELAPISGRSVDVGRRIDIARRRRVGRGAEQLLGWALAGEQLPRLAEQHRTVAHTQARDARPLATTALVERHYACDPHQGVVAVAARHFEEGGSSAGGERWQRDFDEQLAGRERGLEHALEKV